MAENTTGILASTPQSLAGVGISEAPNSLLRDYPRLDCVFYRKLATGHLCIVPNRL